MYIACSAFNLRCQAQVCLERVRVTDPCTFSHAHTRALSTDPTQKFLHSNTGGCNERRVIDRVLAS